MKRYIISIAEPCSADWQAMTPVERGRFCMQCAKEVVDFSGMTDAEVVRYYEKHGKVCGRFLRSQLDREMYAPVVKRRLLPAAVLAGALSLLVPESGKGQQVVTGVVMDHNCAPIPGAEVYMNGREIGRASLEGNFTLEIPADSMKGLQLEFRFIGYEWKVVNYTANTPMEVVLEATVLGGSQVVIVERPKKHKRKKKQ